MIKKTVQLKKDDKCPLCKKLFLNEQGKLEDGILAHEQIGTVHQGCFYSYHQEETLKLLFQIRCYSIGDTIATTPVIREIRRLYPKIHITICTFYPDLFKNNPYINSILDFNNKILQSTIDEYQIRIDGFSEINKLHFAMHSVEFASMSAMNHSLIPTNWGYDLFYDKDDKDSAVKTLETAGIDIVRDKVILIHPHRTEWITRNWGEYRFQDLANRIRAKYPDYKLVSIGGKRSEVPSREMKNFIPIEGSIDLFGKFTLLQTAAMMDLPCMKLIVTPDTGTLHIAATRPELPIVGIFTLIKSYFRTPVRNGRWAYKFVAVESDDPCNCTYENRVFTTEAKIDTCPKKTFLENTKRNSLPVNIKIDGLKILNQNVNWDHKKLNPQINEEIKKYPDSALPCFPASEKAMRAVDKAMKEYVLND